MVTGLGVAEEFASIAPWLSADERYHAISDSLRRVACPGAEIELNQPQVHRILLEVAALHAAAGCGTMRMYGFGSFQPFGNRTRASSFVTEPAMIKPCP